VLLAVIVIGGGGPVSAEADAGKLIGRVSNTYGSLEDYYFEGTFTIVTEVGGFAQRLEAPFVTAGRAPGKSRLEIDHEALGVFVVCDGDTTWQYFRVFNQYKRDAAVPIGPGLPGRGKDSTQDRKMAQPASFLTYYIAFDSDEATARSIGKKIFELEGRRVDCEVVEVKYLLEDSLARYAGPDTLWIDPESALVMRSVHHIRRDSHEMVTEMVMCFEFDVARSEWAPPDSLFVFKPPEGAKLVADFMPGRAPTDLTGETAPSFKLQDLKGTRHRLGDYTGKVVLIDFWATWCSPCRKELPVIEKLQREFGEHGLVVLAITNEAKKIAEAFIQKHKYSFPVLIDVDGGVFDEYQVSSIPVVFVVDRMGRIADHYVGLRDENELADAIRRAGIKQ
jgi:peroxiredoxin/outer membrane lipoprotein-sorting protein